uniref:HECT domain-containing protein n=1 Tax=Spongospora subterranea TaxID=70186 RepID=A0A0H5R6Z7_9EUKA|eukprot:CRZ09527.1 hypothetical protein [Spongospora subterranea]
MFGGAQAQPSPFGQQAPGMFGQTAQTTQQPLFSTQAPQQQSLFSGQNTSSAGGVLGQQQTQQSIFGQQQQQPLFGGQTPSGGGFGRKPLQGPLSSFTGAQPTQQSSSLFGGQLQQQPSSTGAQPLQQPQQSSSLFGAQPSQHTGASLFGAQQPQSSIFSGTQQPQSSSIFGAPQQTSSLFGGQQPQQTSSLFGAQKPQQTPSLFGSQQQQQTPSLFGAQPAQPSSLFGGSTFGASATAPSLFGGQQQPAQSSLFGTAPSTVGGGQLLPTSQAMPPSAPAWELEIQSILDAYDINNPSCRFQFVLYNKVEDASVLEPSSAFRIHTGLYQQAVRENPDPKHLVPVPALGFDALKQRIAQQAKARSHHATEIDICKERIYRLEHDHDCIKKLNIPEYRQRHLDLSRRLLRIAKTLDIHQGRGFPRSDAELKFSKDLEMLERDAEKVRVNVEGVASAVPMQDAQDAQLDMFRLDSSDPNFKRIYEFLDQQRQSLKGLISLLNNDLRDVNIMAKSYNAKLNPDRIE